MSKPCEFRARLLAAAVVAAATVAAGCGTINTLAVKGVASTLSEGGDTVTSHNDPELIAGDALRIDAARIAAGVGPEL